MPTPLVPGQTVRSSSLDKVGTVARILPGGYVEVFFGPGDRPRLPASDLLPEMTIRERLLGGEWDDAQDFDLATAAQRLAIAHADDPHASLSDSRLEPHPHQVFVTHKAVSGGLYPRLLLADDVGLGKTIEAGLIIKELKARGLVQRTLIIAPASLVTQWERELRTKFNEQFTIYNSARQSIYRNDYPDKNPWTVHNQVVCSLHFARDEQQMEAIAEAGWDLVIFDEAHHVRRSLEAAGEERARRAYQLATRLQDQTRGLLLLTATPLQLQDYEFYSLLALLDPTVFPSYNEFREYSNARAATNRLIGQVELYHRLLPSDQVEVLAELRQASGELASLPDLAERLESEAGREAAIAAISSDNRLAELMIRNRKAKIGGFGKRQAFTLPVEMTGGERAVYDAMRDYISRGYRQSLRDENRALGFVMVTFQKLLTSSPQALVQSLRRRITKLLEEDGTVPAANYEPDDLETEPELSDLFEQAAGSRSASVSHSEEIVALRELSQMVQATGADSKLEGLQLMLSQHLNKPDGKVLIFTQFRETLEYLRRKLSDHYRVVVFHGGIDAREKDAAAEAFRDQAQIMVATEAGSEGRNFQFCNIIVNYDLPWNPMKIEQRIGRLDRIGQKRDVYIFNFSLTGTIESQILDVLQERIHVFEQTIGGLDPILGEMERDITRLVMEHAKDFDREVQALEVSYTDKVNRTREAEQRMADFLMDRASFRTDKANEILGYQPSYGHTELQAFLERYFARVATPVRYRPGGLLVIEPPPIWREQHPELYDRTSIVGTCDPRVAIRQESVEFFAFGNQVFQAAIEPCLADDFPGRVTSRICRGVSDPGKRLLQCNVLVTYEGVRQFRQFIPICVDLDDGTYDELLAGEILHCNSDSNLGPTLSSELQERIEIAWEAVDEEAQTIAKQRAPEVQERNEELYTSERRRLERLYTYRLVRLELDLEKTRGTLSRLSGSGREEDQRVLPIYRKQERDLKDQIQQLTTDREIQLEQLHRKRTIVPNYDIHSAALVTTL